MSVHTSSQMWIQKYSRPKYKAPKESKNKIRGENIHHKDGGSLENQSWGRGAGDGKEEGEVRPWPDELALVIKAIPKLESWSSKLWMLASRVANSACSWATSVCRWAASVCSWAISPYSRTTSAARRSSLTDSSSWRRNISLWSLSTSPEECKWWLSMTIPPKTRPPSTSWMAIKGPKEFYGLKQLNMLNQS